MKKLYITLGFAILILICAGCSQQQNTKKTTGTETNKPKDQETQIQEEEQEEKTEELVVFYGDEQAEFVIKKKVQVLKITKEEILLQLEKAGVIKSGIKLNSCHTEKIDEKNVLVLDFSKEFSDQLKEMGTSGERIMMGSVVNTFLTAYDKEYVTVTVNGKTIESGHTAYEGFLKFFKPGLQSSLELPVSR
ncbi:MAG: GerMN domain-containing protein, partial [Lachnospiraceae bacterium]